MTFITGFRNKIFFDGALPTTKREMRFARLEKLRRKLELFCLNNREGFQAGPARGRLRIDPGKVFRSHSLPQRYKGLPENPFMVAAVFEDLKNRWNWYNLKRVATGIHLPPFTDDKEFPWGGISEMVPGEADIYCSYISRKTGCAVLTNDSDLLIHDLGPEGSVIFLDSIELNKWDIQNQTDTDIWAMELCPAALSRKLGLSSIQRLAYELKRDPHAGLRELIWRSRDTTKTVEDGSDFNRFMEEYQPLTDEPDMKQVNQAALQCLDTRVSELFLQYELPNLHALQEAPSIYLAVLNEDHARRCAWSEGRDIRCLGYSVLNISRPQSHRSTVVLEYVRRGGRMCFDAISLHDENAIGLELEALLDRLAQACVASNNVPTTISHWRIFALNKIYSAKDKNRVLIPSREQLRRFLTFGHMGEKVEWTDIHLLAQMQAIFYSLRILAQLLNVAALGTSITEKARGVLAGLPPLHALMKSRNEIMLERHCEVTINELVNKFFQIQEQVMQQRTVDGPDENQYDIVGQKQDIDEDVEAWNMTQAIQNRPRLDSSEDKLVKRQKVNMYELLRCEE